MTLKLGDASLDWALKHVSAWADTDIFPLPFEYSAIASSWDDLKPFLQRDLDTWAVRPRRNTLVPKHGHGFRPAAQLDPLDTLVYCALVYEVGSDFEAVRVPVQDARVFSYRFRPDGDGRMYDASVNFEEFRRRSLDLATAASYVVMTDIADFFPRLYTHPVENAMRAASAHADHARVLTKLITGWNMSVSYGIPIGPSPSRLISEVAISDVDQALLSEGIEFCRFSDDYRMFVDSPRRAREVLAFLANVLHRNHGLTLQEAKTDIVPADEFQVRFERAERDRERHELEARFEEFAHELGFGGGRYEQIGVEYDDLDEDQQAFVDSLNLWAIVQSEVQAERALDIPLLRFVLGRIKQLGLQDQDDILIQHLDQLAPVFREVVEALIMQAGLSTGDLQRLGARLLDLFDHSTVGHLEYHRDWLLTAFVNEDVLNHKDRLVRLYDSYFDEFTRRAVTLALGRNGVSHWFKTRKQEVFQMSPWTRRAFLYGASCLPGDEAKHWYQSLKPQLDPLELAVVTYARAYPLVSEP